TSTSRYLAKSQSLRYQGQTGRCLTASPFFYLPWTQVLKTTPLHSLHRAAGARMVDFGGFDMPVHYGSQLDEHHAVRRDAGMFDVSHMRVVDIEGPAGAPREFLRYALANNVDKLKTPGKALYSCLLEQHGFVVDDLIVYFLREDFFRLVVNAATADKDIAWLAQQNDAKGARAALKPRADLSIIAVQGPQARDKVWRAVPELRVATQDLKPFFGVEISIGSDLWFVGRTGYTGEEGFELIVSSTGVTALWNALRAQGVMPCGLGARDTLRLEA